MKRLLKNLSKEQQKNLNPKATEENKLLVQFLKSKRLYSKFLLRVTPERYNHVITSSLYMKLASTFRWGDSDEGYQFWYKVDQEWMDFYVKKNK